MKFKQFQIDQIARAALVDGCIGDREPGLGKMIFATAWPLIKRARRCLIVAPRPASPAVPHRGDGEIRDSFGHAWGRAFPACAKCGGPLQLFRP